MSFFVCFIYMWTFLQSLVDRLTSLTQSNRLHFCIQNSSLFYFSVNKKYELNYSWDLDGILYNLSSLKIWFIFFASRIEVICCLRTTYLWFNTSLIYIIMERIITITRLLRLLSFIALWSCLIKLWILRMFVTKNTFC